MYVTLINKCWFYFIKTKQNGFFPTTSEFTAKTNFCNYIRQCKIFWIVCFIWAYFEIIEKKNWSMARFENKSFLFSLEQVVIYIDPSCINDRILLPFFISIVLLYFCRRNSFPAKKCWPSVFPYLDTRMAFIPSFPFWEIRGQTETLPIISLFTNLR